MTQVKICGITNWPDARLAVDLGAAFLGFNFCGWSPRFVPVPRACRIRKRLPRDVATVGVFANEENWCVEDIGRIVRLDFVQLHGRESPRAVGRLSDSFGVIKAFRVGPGFDMKRVAKYADAAAIMLDGFSPKLLGGTGRTFDWRVAKRAKKYGFVFLAGGLTPENVSSAIHAARPYAVDVASGVESAPGKKDAKRLRAFLEAVRETDQMIARRNNEIW
jgi:phosphoribosylanthranilate isomerase